MTRKERLQLAQRLYDDAFDVSRDPRSEEYKRGVLAALTGKALAEPFRCPFKAGTVEFDAWGAGHDEGRAIWLNSPAQLTKLEAQFRAVRG